MYQAMLWIHFTAFQFIIESEYKMACKIVAPELAVVKYDSRNEILD